jgi:cation/acetate symporter
MTITFFGIWFFSITDNSEQAKKEKVLFDSQYFQAQTGFNKKRTFNH